MRYLSTRGRAGIFSSAEAIVAGIAPDGGLFVPEHIPAFTEDELNELLEMTHAQRAKRIFSLFFDFPGASDAAEVYQNFSCRLKDTGDHQILELFHGPTAAFKDMALQVLPRLMSAARKELNLQNRTLILTATSGDTGSAALAGFADVKGTAALVFYPYQGVSGMQKLQMLGQKGENIKAVAVRGNFDDAQTAVKNLFADEELKGSLQENGFELSSANSINWGRLAPQIVYYFTAYAEMVKLGRIRPGQKLSFTVPTGNFGNILAGWYAKQMGLPVDRLICASNKNNVLTQFLETGEYDARRVFYKTISPSMDILISSNLERLLFEVSRRDSAYTAGLMAQLKAERVYQVREDVRTAIRETFSAGFADDEETMKVIGQIWQKEHYLADPHTAVALSVAPTDIPCVTLSTASPYKFPADMLKAVHCTGEGETVGEQVFALNAFSSVPVPAPLAELLKGPEPQEEVLNIADMKAYTLNFAKKLK